MAAGAADIEPALQKLKHFASYKTARYAHAEGVQIGHVTRQGKDTTGHTATSPDGRVAVHLTGHTRRSAKPYGDVTAAGVLEDYLQGRFDPASVDGGFICCIVDLNARRLKVCNDRLGALPLLYARTANGFAFAPEAKALFPTLGIEPRYDATGVINFVTAGYCLGDQTLFQGIRYLEPGSMLTIDLDTLAVDCTRYWRLIYRPDKSLSDRRHAVEVLYEAITASHESLLNPDAPFDVLLSGGYDSRCMLASAIRAGRVPKRCFGWGMRPDIPYSDPEIAARIARRFKQRFDFLQYDTGQFVQNLRSWSYISELSTDNIGWYAEGAPALTANYDSSMAFSLVGDEAWGYGGRPDSRERAIAINLPAEVSPYLLKLAPTATADDFRDRYAVSLQHVVAGAENTSAEDLKDYLYIQGRVPRFIFSLGYYKELATEIRRPFLTGRLLEVMSRMPPQFRWHKNLFRSVLHDRFPELRGLGINISSGLPDWEYDIHYKPALRDVFSGILTRQRLARSAVSQWVDPAAVERGWLEHLKRPVLPVDRHVSRLRVLKHLMMPEALKIRRAMRGPDDAGLGRKKAVDLYRALVMLVSLEEQFPALTAA